MSRGTKHNMDTSKDQQLSNNLVDSKPTSQENSSNGSKSEISSQAEDIIGSIKTEPLCSCKVGKKTEEYDLIGEYKILEDKWLGKNGYEETPIRKITKEFNYNLFHNIAGNVVDDNYREIFEAFRNEDHEGYDEVRYTLDNELSEAYINEMTPVEGVSDLEKEFLSHQTIYNHLSKCLDVKKNNQKPTDTLNNEDIDLRDIPEKIEENFEKEYLDILVSRGVVDEEEVKDVRLHPKIVKTDNTYSSPKNLIEEHLSEGR